MTVTAFSDLNDTQVTWIGALDFDDRPNGISPRRLPDWTRSQVPQVLDAMLRMPSGVRLRFSTDSSTISLTVLCSAMAFSLEDRGPVVFDLEVFDEPGAGIHSLSTTEGNTILFDPKTQQVDIHRGEPATLTFSGLGDHTKTCELWLPHNAYVELRSLEIDDGSSLDAAPDSRPHWIHYGSSISHCSEARQPSHIWPAVAARNAGLNVQNLGFGGQCHLDPFVARTMRDSGADLISIKAGINIVNMDSMRDRIFTPLLHGFIDTIRENNPTTPIVVISPIYCPRAEDHPGPTVANSDGKADVINRPEALSMGSLTLSRIRELIKEVIRVRDDPNLHYYNGLDLFGEGDRHDLPDDLHPNPEGYIRMGDRFASQVLAELLPENRGES